MGAFINCLRNAGCTPSAVAHVATIPFKPADAGLPKVVPVAGDRKGAVGLFRRLRTFMPIPGFGDSLEVVGEALIGER
jgi:hypothetical protein